MIKLKPCPFCGRDPDFLASHDICDGTFYPAKVQCFYCGIEIRGANRQSFYGWATKEDFAHSDQTAIEAWNRRADGPKRGKWVWLTPYTVKCSNCGKIINTRDAYCEKFTDLSRTDANVFCRYCGADMRQDEPQTDTHT